jgi:rod shape-determining protein MreD
VSPLRVGLVAVLAVTAVLVQSTVLAPLGLPGAAPDPLLVVVVALAQAWGAVDAAVAGFAMGLLADVLPPSDGSAGRWAAVLALVGFAAGRFFERSETAPLRTLLAVALAAPASVLASAFLSALIGDPGLGWPGVPRLVVTSVAYDVLLAPLVIPLTVRLARAALPQPSGLRL